jgi:D-serine deaminase-like pyridoxal phosphate-dependent protein
MITFQDYSVADPDALETPAMLLFQDMMDRNIRSVCELVGGGENLIAHVKTHKSEAVARKEVELGIAGFKCATLKELEMVLQAGARKAILSYPQCQEIKIERLCELTLSYPDAWIAAIASSPFHLEVLSTVATRREQSLNVMLDLDAGMHRTGIGFGPDATKLYQEIDAHPYFRSISSRSKRKACPSRVWSPAAVGHFPTTHVHRACTDHLGRSFTGTGAIAEICPICRFVGPC